MKIVVFCNAGLSSGMIVQKMKKVSPEDEINAYQSSKMETELPKADVVLLSPALRFMLESAEKIGRPLGIPCGVIEMRAYGVGDEAAVMKQVHQLLADKGGK